MPTTIRSVGLCWLLLCSLLDCQGKRITFVYDHEGEVYDEDDL